jgi:hypothetical protein
MLKNSSAGVCVFCAVMIFLCCRADDCAAGFRLDDPGLAAGETIMYINTSGSVAEQVEERVELQNRNGSQVYVITSKSPKLTTTVTIDKKSMQALSVRMLRTCGDAVVESSTQVSGRAENTSDAVITIPHFTALKYLLRGYPFEKREKIKIDYYGNENKTFIMSVAYKKKEKVALPDGKQVECYRLDVGIEGFWGTLLPKLKLWYAVEPPHAVVKAHGPTGPPGSPDYELVMTGYKQPAAGP